MARGGKGISERAREEIQKKIVSSSVLQGVPTEIALTRVRRQIPGKRRGDR